MGLPHPGIGCLGLDNEAWELRGLREGMRWPSPSSLTHPFPGMGLATGWGSLWWSDPWSQGIRPHRSVGEGATPGPQLSISPFLAILCKIWSHLS